MSKLSFRGKASLLVAAAALAFGAVAVAQTAESENPEADAAAEGWSVAPGGQGWVYGAYGDPISAWGVHDSWQQMANGTWVVGHGGDPEALIDEEQEQEQEQEPA